MARQARVIVPGLAHLVRQSGHNGGVIAHDEHDVRRWREILRDVAATHRVTVHGFALMATEYRLLVRPVTGESLGRMVQDLGRRYVAAFNARHARRGTLWAGRYQCAAVEAGDFERAALLYVDGCDGPVLLMSSRPHHLGDGHDASLVDPPSYWTLGNTPFERHAAWRSALDAGLSEPARTVLGHALVSGRPWASPGVLAQLQAGTAVPLVPRRRGRPSRAVGA